VSERGRVGVAMSVGRMYRANFGPSGLASFAHRGARGGWPVERSVARNRVTVGGELSDQARLSGIHPWHPVATPVRNSLRHRGHHERVPIGSPSSKRSPALAHAAAVRDSAAQLDSRAVDSLQVTALEHGPQRLLAQRS